MNPTIPMRRLGMTDIAVTPIAMGCWPIAGVTSIDVNEADSRATLAAAFDAGINFFDTAHIYGYDGISERFIGETLGAHRHEIVIATKGGLHWRDRAQIKDASPARLRFECQESLRRLKTDHVDLLYLHAPDPTVPIAESAAALQRLMAEGKTRAVGVSNVTLEQMQEFAAVCPVAAVQPPYNMLQREIEASQLPWCIEHQIAVVGYWPLMKGLLAGHLARDHEFSARDGRHKYPMFQGQEWLRNQDFLDQLRLVAVEVGRSVPQVVLNWTIHRPGITVALAGAKRAHQIRDNAGGMGWRLTAEHTARINCAIEARGPIKSRGAVT